MRTRKSYPQSSYVSILQILIYDTHSFRVCIHQHTRTQVRVAARLATDKSVSTRKRALQLVTALLLRCPSNEEWQTLWLQYVLPGIHDAETTVQNISIEAVDRLILAPLSSSARSKDVDTNSTWLLLRKIPLSSGCQTMLCLQTALRKAPSNRLTPRLLSLLLDTAVKMEKDVNSGISWALLQELVRTTKLQKHFDLDIVVKCFGTTLISIEDDELCSSHPSVIPSTFILFRSTRTRINHNNHNNKRYAKNASHHE